MAPYSIVILKFRIERYRDLYAGRLSKDLKSAVLPMLKDQTWAEIYDDSTRQTHLA
jgi:hypothetical protein